MTVAPGTTKRGWVMREGRSRNHATSLAYDFNALPGSEWREPSTPTTPANPGRPWIGQPGSGRAGAVVTRTPTRVGHGKVNPGVVVVVAGAAGQGGALLKRAALPLLGQRQGGGGGWGCCVRNSNKEKKDASSGSFPSKQLL